MAQDVRFEVAIRYSFRPLRVSLALQLIKNSSLNLGMPLPQHCQLLVTEFEQTEDVVANCQRECFAVYSCDSDADCPDNLPFCNAGQCAVSAPTFSPTDGMGGGSSA